MIFLCGADSLNSPTIIHLYLYVLVKYLESLEPHMEHFNDYYGTLGKGSDFLD